MTPLQEKINERFFYLNPQFDVPLGPLTYFKIGGPADVFIEVKLRQELINVVQFCLQQQIPFTMLGGASNVIIDDQGLRGVVIQTSNEDFQVMEEIQTEGKQRVRVGAGYRTALFVRRTLDLGLTGLEYFMGVPGKVGGALVNNAHYLAHLTNEYVDRVEVIQPSGEVVWLREGECAFGYDTSRFQTSHEVIVQAEFVLPRGDHEQSMQMIREATEYRAKTQPLGEASSGCYFRNVPNTPALQIAFPQYAERREFPTAFLIDQAGLKGSRVGGVQVSKKHAAFLINTGNGTSANVTTLVEQIKSQVHDKFGVELAPEVFWLK